MTLYPQIQQRARAEIERVVGKDHLPILNDQKDLPYVMAIIKEVLRWAPIAPLGIAASSFDIDIHELISQRKVYRTALPKTTRIGVSGFPKAQPSFLISGDIFCAYNGITLNITLT